MVCSKIKKFFKVLRNLFYKLFVLMLFVMAIAVAIVGYKFAPVFKEYVDEADGLVRNSSASSFYPNNTSHVYASDGTELAKLHIGADSSYLEYSDIPADVIHAFVAIEDKRYYQHKGVDLASTAKSFYLLVSTGDKSRGGSTITQQLVRNVFTEHIGFEKSYVRKVKEILTALFMERRYSKEQILEFYINNVNYGNNYFGIGAASLGYFGKSADELSPSEIAFLCAIPNNPTYYNPRENLNHTMSRRNIILREMYNQGYLGEKDYLVAVNSGVSLIDAQWEFHDYESSYAIKCATEYLMRYTDFAFQYNFDTQVEYDRYREEYSQAYSEAEHLLYTGGYEVYTTIDLEVQAQTQKFLDEELKSFTSKDKNGVYKMQGAATVIDNDYGKVIACVGGRDPAATGYSLNRSYQAYMQPGSSIKPLIVYTPALQNGYTADTIVHDQEIKDGPKNSDGKYMGDITLRTAVEKSRNTIAWQLFSELTPRKGLEFVQQMHFDKITPNDYYNPASLGGLYYGVNTVQMASGYATLANGGEYRTPDCIKMILDKNGENIYEREAPVRVYTTKASNRMLNILTGVATNGTARGLVLKDNKKMPVAVKTGTTNGGRCAWLCGVTPYYSVAVYVGRDDNKKTEGLQGASYPLAIWTDVQNYLCKGKYVKSIYTKEKKKPSKKKSETGKNTEDSTEVADNGADNDAQSESSQDTPQNNQSSQQSSQSSSPSSTQSSPEDKPKKPKPTKPKEPIIPEPEEPEEPELEEPDVPEEPEEPDVPEEPGGTETVTVPDTE